MECELLERLLTPTDATPRFLDAGCGPGTTLADLVCRGRAVGLDASRAQPAPAAAAVPGAALVEDDLAALPFPDDRLDVVVSPGTLMHLAADVGATAVEEFAGVVRPGGRLLVSDGVTSWSGDNSDWMGAGVRMTWEVAGIEAVVADLERAGFELLDRETAPDELADDEGGTMVYALAEHPA